MSVIGTFPTETYPDGVSLTEFNLTSLAQDVPFKSSYFTVPPNTLSDEDQHDVVEIWYVAMGQVTVHLDQEVHEIDAGHAIYFSPQRVHRAENRTDEDCVIVSLWWSSGDHGR